MQKILISILGFIVLLNINSCKKQTDDNIDSAQDNAAFETEFAAIYDAVADFSANNGNTGKTGELILPGAARVFFTDSLLSDSDGIVFTIDYGLLNNGGLTKGIICKDGRYRAGKIHVGMTKRWTSFPCIVTISISTADNYFVGNGVNMYQLSGLTTVSRSSETAFTIDISNATFQRDNGTAKWECNRTAAITLNSPGGVWGDEMEIIGTSSGTNKNGVSFTAETVSPLKKVISLSCLETFVKGEWQLSSGGNTFTVNYDPDNNEHCDRKISVSVNGKTKTMDVW